MVDQGEVIRLGLLLCVPLQLSPAELGSSNGETCNAVLRSVLSLRGATDGQPWVCPKPHVMSTVNPVLNRRPRRSKPQVENAVPDVPTCFAAERYLPGA